MAMCTSCSHVDYQPGFLLYQDPAIDLVAYVYPIEEEERAEELKKMMLVGYRQAQIILEPSQRRSTEPLLLFGLDALAASVREADQRKLEEDIEKAKRAP